MKSVIPVRLHHSWTYVLMALVIFQLVEFSDSLPYATQPRLTYCDESLEPAVKKVCGAKEYDITEKTELASKCCSPGCTKFQLRRFCQYVSSYLTLLLKLFIGTRPKLFSTVSDKTRRNVFFLHKQDSPSEKICHEYNLRAVRFNQLIVEQMSNK